MKCVSPFSPIKEARAEGQVKGYSWILTLAEHQRLFDLRRETGLPICDIIGGLVSSPHALEVLEEQVRIIQEERQARLS